MSRIALPSIVVCVLLGCAAAETPLPSKRASATQAPSEPSHPSDWGEVMPSGTVGPFLSRSGQGWIALWARPDDEGADWLSVAFDAKGLPQSDHRLLTGAPPETRLVRLRSLANGHVLVLFTSSEPGGDALRSFMLGTRGEVVSPPISVSDARSEIVWIDAVALGDRMVLAWAERTGDRAELFSRVLHDGRAASAHHPLGRDAHGWQLVSNGEVALLASVSTTGALRVDRLDLAGKSVGRTTIEDGGVTPNVDAIATPTGFVLAYESRGELQSKLMSVLFSPHGVLATRPVLATAPLGEPTLVQLVEGGSGAIVWHNEPREPGWLRVARLSATGQAAGEELLVPTDPELPLPEFTSRGDGFAALSWGCSERPGCDAPLYPTLTQLDATLAPRSVRPWKIGEAVPDLAWNLSCNTTRCLGLTASFGDPTRVYTRGDDSAPPSKAVAPMWPDDTSPPRAATLQAAVPVPELSDVQVVGAPDGTLVTWLSYFDPSIPYEIPQQPAPDGRMAPVRALLATQWVPEEDKGERWPSEVISYRAHSPGGVALASKPSGALIAWTALDQGQPQVFTTLTDRRGKRTSQRMQTRARGEVTQVSASAADTGWLIAWLDERSGASKSYAARVEDNLNRRTQDQQLPPTNGIVHGVQARMHGDQAWLLAAIEEGGRYHLRLQRTDERLKPLQQAVDLADGEEPYSSLSLLLSETARWAVWIAGPADRGRALARPLDISGRPTGPSRELAHDGWATRLSGDCDPGACPVSILARTAEGPALFGADLARSSGRVRYLFRMVSADALEVPASTQGGRLWFYDGLAPANPQRAVHRAEIEW